MSVATAGGDAVRGVGAADEVSQLSAWFALGVFVLASVLSSVDLQILVLLADPMKKTLGMSDTQLGVMHGVGLSLIVGVAAIPVGWIADRFDRRWVLGSFILIWSMATIACGAAPSYAWLFVFAVGLGIAKSGVQPIVWGLIPEVFPERQRMLANTTYTFVTLLATGLGISLAGVLLDALRDTGGRLPPPLRGAEVWRLALYVLGAIGPFVALLVLFIRKHALVPTAAQVQVAKGDSATTYVRRQAKTVMGVFGAFGIAGMGIGAIQAWLPVAASRSFGDSPASVGKGLGVAVIVATLLGAGLAPLAVRRLQPLLGTATPMRLTCCGMALSALAALALPLAQSAVQLYAGFVVFMVPLVGVTVLLPTLVQDISPPQMRSRVTAGGIVFAALVASVSPVLVGLISDALQPRADGLLLAVAGVGAVSMVAGAIIVRLTESAFARTVDALRAPSAEAATETLAADHRHHPEGTTP